MEVKPGSAASPKRSLDVALAGDELVYTFRLRNAGHDTLYSVGIDTAVDVEGLPADGVTLEQGQTLTFYSTGNKVTAAHVSGGQVDNSAVANGRDSAGQPVPSNMTMTSVPTSNTPVIIETGGGAGEETGNGLWIAGGGGLLAVAAALMLLAWDRDRRRKQQPAWA